MNDNHNNTLVVEMNERLGRHPLHEVIANKIRERFDGKDGIRVLISNDCGGKQRIPMYGTEPYSNTRISDADLLIVKNRNIVVHVEIEEGDRTPIRILSKLFASQVSSKYVYRGGKGERGESIPYSDQGYLFIQIIEKGNANDRRKEAWKNLGNIISLKLKERTDSCNILYCLLYGNKEDFINGMEGDVLIKKIKGILIS